MNKITENWDTKAGLIVYTIAVPFAVSLTTLGVTKSPWAALAVFLCFWIPYGIAWKVRRSFWFIKKKINIVFALHNVDGSEGVSGLIRIIEHQIRQEITQQIGIIRSRRVKIKFLPSDRRIANTEEAERKIKKGYVGHTLMVWGSVIKVGDEVSCRRNNFTYEFSLNRYYPEITREEIKRKFGVSMQKTIDSASWNLNLSKTGQFGTYVNNLYDISFYIIGRTLLTTSNHGKGIEILESLLSRTNSMPEIERRQRGGFISSLAEILAEAHWILAGANIFSDRKKMEYHCERALRYREYHYGANLMMAYIRERFYDDEEGAEFRLMRAETFARSRQQDHYFSRAYFALKRGQYKKAIAFYKKLEKADLELSPVPLSAAEDLRGVFEKTKEKAFLFGEAYIAFTWLPQYRRGGGKSLFKKFIKNVNNDENYTDLINEVARILEN